MRILVILGLMMFLGLGAASAVTVDLINGNTVQGDIIKQDDKSLQINVDGVTMTYYADEIKDIDGKPFAAPTPAARSSAPVVQPETAADQGTGNIAALQPETAAQPEAAPQPQAAAGPETVAQPEAAAPAPGPQTGTIDPEKRALILKFIDVFGTRQALTNNFNLMIQQIEKDKPDEAEKIRDRVKVDEIIERLLPIYDRNFTSDDLKAFIAFYGSAEGRKLISTIPELMKESVGESVKYMEDKFPEVKQGQ